MQSRILLTIMLALLTAACSKVTLENYDKIKTGMAYDAVTGILGKPDSCSEMLTLKSCRWGGEQRFVVVNFVGDKVVLTSAENLR